jgi:hypothetical protein
MSYKKQISVILNKFDWFYIFYLTTDKDKNWQLENPEIFQHDSIYSNHEITVSVVLSAGYSTSSPV